MPFYSRFSSRYAMTQNDHLITQTASLLLRRYGHRLTLQQLADHMGRPIRQLQSVPHQELPRMSVNKLGKVVYCLDAARYICSTYTPSPR